MLSWQIKVKQESAEVLMIFCPDILFPWEKKSEQKMWFSGKGLIKFSVGACFRLRHELCFGLVPLLLGGWTNPIEKYAQVKMGENLPQISGWKFQKYLSCHHLDGFFLSWNHILCGGGSSPTHLKKICCCVRQIGSWFPPRSGMKIPFQPLGRCHHRFGLRI